MDPRPDSAEQIEERAADWLARRAGDSWSTAEQRQLDEWLRASTAHKVAFLRLEAVWQQASRLKALSAGTPAAHRKVPPPGRLVALACPRSTRPLFSRLTRRDGRFWGTPYFRPTALASVLIAVILAATAYFRPLHGTTFRTEVGVVSAVPMSDGSKVTLNTDSQVRIAVTEKERRVNLGRGEAFFEVAKDPSRPFVVIAGDCKVVAVGTKFSVWREANEVRVAVTEGRVMVTNGTGGATERSAAEVAAGSVAHAGAAGVLVQRERLNEVEEVLSWRRGVLFFHDVPLSAVVAEFNRYNARKIVLANPAVADIRIGGSFRSTNVDGFVRLLQDGFSIHVEHRGEQIVLSGD